ncbi:hypothetical protein QBC34DRAFT_464846 [Podospora aff. communis PSN243]|uniref:Stc1 domain-containing protein n=1 Tax=Podospora aff. communis PSN243 TaxID=3040156 RepID=A0AAV9H7C8_9PEZI|nr:hypothetical protein QBC34DRAFT_464846 [Podospora aff. communis PSN243]
MAAPATKPGSPATSASTFLSSSHLTTSHQHFDRVRGSNKVFGDREASRKASYTTHQVPAILLSSLVIVDKMVDLECSACMVSKPALTAFTASQRRNQLNRCISCVDFFHRLGIEGIMFPDVDEDGCMNFRELEMEWMDEHVRDWAIEHDWDIENKQKVDVSLHVPMERNVGRGSQWKCTWSKEELDGKILDALEKLENEKIPDRTDEEWDKVAPLNKDPAVVFNNPDDILMASLDAEEYLQSDEWKEMKKAWAEMPPKTPTGRQPVKATATANSTRGKTPAALSDASSPVGLSPKTPVSPAVSVGVFDEAAFMAASDKLPADFKYKYSSARQMPAVKTTPPAVSVNGVDEGGWPLPLPLSAYGADEDGWNTAQSKRSKNKKEGVWKAAGHERNRDLTLVTSMRR